jgi:cytochrome c peroxidase
MKRSRFGFPRFRGAFGAALVAALLSAGANAAEQQAEPAQVAIGERLFLETRFAQAYATHPDRADPVVQTAPTINGDLPGPFAGRTINCRSCHLVDELLETPGGGMRAYADFARRSPITARSDHKADAGRNAQTLVGAALPRPNALLLHHDGEFATLEDLVLGTLTGRNMGWLPGEEAQARAHIADVIRSDGGRGELAREFGGAYAAVLKGTSKDIPPELRLPEKYRLDTATASDAQILDAVARLIAAYLEDLEFSRDEQGRYNGSPYDAFLAANGLPRAPAKGETPAAYSRRLLAAINALDAPRFVGGNDRRFAYHNQAFAFGEKELEGLRLFFARSGSGGKQAANCIACHAAPNFTDFGFHNTGVTQTEYDAVHGAGSFATLPIPAMAERNADYDAWLPPTERHPKATGRCRAVAAIDRPGFTDLGLWNVLGNPDMPHPQGRIIETLCGGDGPCTAASLLPRAIAAFKTPGLRDLGHSGPYMHNGSLDTLEDVLGFYVTASAQARSGALRNPAPQIADVHISAADIEPLAAFLRSLNEDYD